MTTIEARKELSGPNAVADNAFPLLRHIADLINSQETEADGRDLLIRVFDRREEFAPFEGIIDSLAGACGLYPFASIIRLNQRECIAYEAHRPTDTGENLVFHREQSEVYRRLLDGESVILSAPTSFGKSRIVDALLATMRFLNIAIVVPTLALIDETRRRLHAFSANYRLVTHLTQKPGLQRNIFIFTPERVVAYSDFPKIDLFVVDEFYKIGDLEKDEHRTIALNEAFYKLLKSRAQFYLLGPNIQQIPNGLESAFRCQFFPTTFSTVAVNTYMMSKKGRDLESLLELLKGLAQPTLVYCGSPAKANQIARAALEVGVGSESPALNDASSWLGDHYHPDWVLAQALKRGIGIHHGRLPRSISQFVVRSFNDGRCNLLICTSTLIEGVNTKAKNVVIWDNKLGKRPLDFFTFSNIKGRSGRMFQHFVGNVYLFADPPPEKLPFVDFPLFSQSDAVPESLLIQMEKKDLSEASRQRVEKFELQDNIGVETLRLNHSVDPTRQIELAKHIRDNAAALWPYLNWKGFPADLGQLRQVCELAWTFLLNGRPPANGVFSAKQMAFKIGQLRRLESYRQRVLNELSPGPYAARSADEAVERVLEFDRNWAGFHIPQLFSAVSSIQADVFRRLGRNAGDYSPFAASIEALFRKPIISALDEYGIPLDLAERIAEQLNTSDDLDIAFESIKGINVNSRVFSPFEEELLRDAQQNL